MKVEIKYVPISLVDYNEGQLDGVPANPRTRDDSRQAKLAESIEELPEMSEARPPLVFPYNGRYIVIGGNRRLEAFHALKREEIPIVTLPADTSVEHLRRMVLIDNESTGETDWAAVMKNWKADELESWGIDVPGEAWTAKAMENYNGKGDANNRLSDKYIAPPHFRCLTHVKGIGARGNASGSSL